MASPVIDPLNKALADAIVFYHKLHHYHWHVTGPQFFRFHEQFEVLYERWAQLVDDLAERVVALGGRAHPTLAGALDDAQLAEDASCPDPGAMLGNVIADLRAQRDRFQEIARCADEAGDRATAGMMDELIGDVEKRLWMLEAWRQ